MKKWEIKYNWKGFNGMHKVVEAETQSTAAFKIRDSHDGIVRIVSIVCVGGSNTGLPPFKYPSAFKIFKEAE